MKVLNLDFDNYDALYLLGVCYLQRNQYGFAANLYKNAILLKSDHFEAWNNLGNCYKGINKEHDAEACWKAALAIEGKSDSDYADIYNNLATLYVNAGEPESGMKYIEQCLNICPDHVDGNWNKSLLLLEQGKFGEGFDLYRWGFQTKHRMNREFGKEIPYWNGEKGRNVVVWGEQGIGDELLFASMIPELCDISASVVFECHPRLFKIFQHSFRQKNLYIYGTRKDAFVTWPNKHTNIDARVAIGDLGKYFRRELKDFPQHSGYLQAIPERVEHYRRKIQKVGSRLKVGISWTGGYLKTRKDYRSINLTELAPLFQQDADFISLQYTSDAYSTIAETEDLLDCRIHHWPSAVQNDDYHETAALVSALDLVITVNTAVHHLAGAMGKPVWTLTPKAKAWRYWTPDGNAFPWYPSARCYEQREQGNWTPIVQRIAGELAALINSNNGNKLHEHKFCHSN